MLLRAKMQEHLVDWKNDLPEAWRDVFRDVDINLTAIPNGAEIPDDIAIFPGRRNQAINDAPEGAHICRAFDGIEPRRVQVVVLGQDPYPAIEAATGRAFEDGTADNLGQALRPALCALGQSALELLEPDIVRPAYCHNRNGRAAAIRENFDRLSRAGVLFSNTAWTFTRREDRPHHIRLWEPILSRFFHYLNEREAANNEHEDPHLVLLLLGDDAQDTVDNLQLADNQRVRKIEPYHPTNRQNRYFQGSNPLQRVNEELRELGGQEISWWE